MAETKKAFVGKSTVSKYAALAQQQAQALMMRHGLRVNWLTVSTEVTTRIREARREVEDAVHRARNALKRYADATGEAAAAYQGRIVDGLDESDAADEREAIWQAGYQASTEDRSKAVRGLLADIKVRLLEDADGERDRMDAVSEQTQSLLRRVTALHEGRVE